MVKNNIYSKRSGFYAWPQFRILGLMAIVYGIYKLYTNDLDLFGAEVLLIIAGVLANLMTKGIQLDFANPRYREYVGVVGLKYGKWIDLPKIDYVTVFNQLVVKQGGMQSLSYRNKNKVFMVRLVADEEHFFDVSAFESKENALETATVCAKKLDTKLLDNTD